MAALAPMGAAVRDGDPFVSVGVPSNFMEAVPSADTWQMHVCSSGLLQITS